LIEAIQLGSFVVLEFGVGPVRLKQAGCEQGAEAEVKLGRIGDNARPCVLQFPGSAAEALIKGR